MIKHDEQGFLVGERIELDRAISIWNAIRDDIRAIRQSITGLNVVNNPDNPASNITTATSSATTPNPINRIILDGALISVAPLDLIATPSLAATDRRVSSSNFNRNRDEKGRFVSNDLNKGSNNAIKQNSHDHSEFNLPEINSQASESNISIIPIPAATIATTTIQENNLSRQSIIRERDSKGRFVASNATDKPVIATPNNTHITIEKRSLSEQLPQDKAVTPEIKKRSERNDIRSKNVSGLHGDSLTINLPEINIQTTESKKFISSDSQSSHQTVLPKIRELAEIKEIHTDGRFIKPELHGTVSSPTRPDLLIKGNKQKVTEKLTSSERLSRDNVVTPNAKKHSEQKEIKSKEKLGAIDQPEQNNRDNKNQFTSKTESLRIERDVNGRFVKKTVTNDQILENKSTDSVVRTAAVKLINAVGNAGSGMEDTDPAIKAFQEVAQPLSRGYETMLGGDRETRRRESWFRRIFGELKLLRKEETVFNKAANRSLKNIEDKPVSSSGGSLSFILGAGIIATILSALVKRIPLLGALFSSAGNIVEILKGNKSKGIGGVAGTFAGMYGGAKIGAFIGAFVGPIVAAIGGAIGGMVGLFLGNEAGQIIGEKIGEWTEKLEQADIPGKISKAWDSFTESLSSKISSGWDSLTNFIKDKFGIDLNEKLEPIKEAGKKVIDKAKRGIEYVSDAVARARDAVGDMLSIEKEKALPRGYRHKASFDGVKGGKGLEENGTYTTYEANRIKALKNSGANTSGNIEGGISEEIRNRIIAQAKKSGANPETALKFAAMESGGNPNAISSTGAIGLFQLTGRTATALGVRNRFDIDENIKGGIAHMVQDENILRKSGLPVTDENLYMMLQLGPRAAMELIRGSESGKFKHELSPETQKAMNHNLGANSKTASEYLAVNRNALDSRYAATVTASLSATEPPVTPKIPSTQIISASAPAPQAPRISPPPATPEAPPVVTPLASNNDKRKTTVVAVVQSDVGQDVKDRRIANIVTGGLSGN